MLDAVASALEKDVQKAKKTDKITVFLGGSCEDNSWREELKKEFPDIFFLDPYDEKWDPKDNIYDELAGLVNSDWVIFYRGGKQTEREHDFLDNISKSENVKEFDDVSAIKKFLSEVKQGKKKLACISGAIRKASQSVLKEAMPWLRTHLQDIDLLFEHMDTESIKGILKDLDSGATIHIPPMYVPGKGRYPEATFTKNDFPPEYYRVLVRYLENFGRKPKNKDDLLGYDSKHHSYIKKEAKHGATYSLSSTQVELPESIAKEVISWGKNNIPDEDLYTKDADKGREDEIHVTLLYGIEDNDPADVIKLLKGVKPFECRLGLVTAFKDKDDYDVLKVDVESPELIKLHYLIRENVKNKNKYENYQAHVTIAYLKKGRVNRLIGDDRFRGSIFSARSVIYSSSEGIKYTIALGV